MINVERNRSINQALCHLYESYREDYLAAYRHVFNDPEPPKRINEFGIIDVNRYDTDAGILFIAKETNGWSNEDFKSGHLFRDWVEDISKNGVVGKGHVQRHPGMWYNLGRWALYLNGSERDINTIASYRKEALPALGTIAFTNLNKVRGWEQSRREYAKLSGADISAQLLREELELLRPKIVVCCGTVAAFRNHAPAYFGTVINMPHPAARIRPVEMLRHMAAQLPS